jgi:hypothetical protein
MWLSQAPAGALRRGDLGFGLGPWVRIGIAVSADWQKGGAKANRA